MLSSGLDVWQIVELLPEYGADLEALTADRPPLDERTLALAHANAQRFPEEIELHRRSKHPSLEELQTLYPFIAA